MAAAVARVAARLSPAREPRRNSRRALRGRLHRRAVRLPEAIGTLREVRRQPHDNEWLVVSGADPLNLAGILTPGPRLAALAGNRLLVQDGVPAAMLSGGEVRLFAEVDPATDWLMRKALLGNMRRHELETSGTIGPPAEPARNYRRVKTPSRRSLGPLHAPSSPRLDLAAMGRHTRVYSRSSEYLRFLAIARRAQN